MAAVKPPVGNEGEDQLYWGHTSSGAFSVKSAYFLQEDDSGAATKDWKAIWNWQGSQRVRVFLWLAAKGKLMTNLERGRRHMSDDVSCTTCGATCEDVDHVLRRCAISREVWRNISVHSNAHSFFSLPFDTWFFANLQDNLSSGIDSWSITFGITCWCLWNQRNNFIFNHETRSSSEIVHNIRAMVNYTRQAQNYLQLGVPRLGFKSECLIGWIPPPHSWVKINSDGAVHSPLNNASSGGLLRNSHGDWIFGYSRNIGICSVIQAELWGALDGLELAWNRGYRQVILELDSKIAAEAILTKETNANAYFNVLSAIKELVGRNWKVYIQHTYREGNRCADWMARLGFNHPIGVSVYELSPDGIRGYIMEDLMGVSLPRLCRRL